MGFRVDGIPGNVGDIKNNLNIPVNTRRMESSPVRNIIKFEESLSVDEENEVPNAKKFEKLPIKLLIAKYENMKVV